jgi:putative hydrolase of HD superfamily
VPSESYDRDIEFIYEMGCLRFMQRTWVRFLNPGFQNNSEHAYRVAWIALIIARHEKVTNIEKILLMALSHDISESRTGDVDYLSRQYVDRNEVQGVDDMIAGTILAPDLLDLWNEYEARQTIEAKIVKDTDYLDIDFELSEQAARGHAALRESKAKMRRHVSETKLSTKTAKLMWEQIQSSNPHAWHANARNRYNAGEWSDWKQDSPKPDPTPET